MAMVYGYGLYLWSMSIVQGGSFLNGTASIFFYFLFLLYSFLAPSCVPTASPPRRRGRRSCSFNAVRETCFPPASFKLLGGGSQAECRPTPPCKPPDLPNDQPPAAVERHLLTSS